jgi:hypothetical protein
MVGGNVKDTTGRLKQNSPLPFLLDLSADAKFVGNRFDPLSENGRAARFKELAECGGCAVPCTQEEMRRLLAGESDPAVQPQQMDFTL